MSVKTYTLTVSPKNNGETLLSFLRGNLKEYPSVKAVKRAIDGKKCKINGRVEYFSTHRVKAGDKVVIALGSESPKFKIQTLYEDESLIIINKPPGIPSESFTEYIFVHRLDKDTSGVMILAKTEEAKEGMFELFAERKIEKEYLAICDGIVSHEKWRDDNYLGRKAKYQGGVLFGKVPKEKGRRAVTDFITLKKANDASLLLVKPITGRTHQIRVHLKDQGHPVLGDWQYGKEFTCKYEPPRQMLHAHKVVFSQPLTGEKIQVEAPSFPDFLEAKKALFEA